MALTIHLGTYKTATTSLQRLLKDKKEYLNSLGYDVYAGTFDRGRKAMKKFHAYLKENQTKREFIYNFDNYFLKGSNNKKIISEEMILGPLQKGPFLYGDNIKKLVSALDDITIPYKIVFVIRRLDLLLESLYVHNFRVGFTRKSFDRFYENLDFRMCHWSRVLNELGNGKNLSDLSILPFEICLSDSHYYVEKVMSALGLPNLDWGQLPMDNISIGKKGYSVICSFNENESLNNDDKKHLTELVRTYFAEKGDSKIDFFSKFRKFLIDYYRTDNEKVTEKYFPDIPKHYFQNLFDNVS